MVNTISYFLGLGYSGYIFLTITFFYGDFFYGDFFLLDTYLVYFGVDIVF